MNLSAQTSKAVTADKQRRASAPATASPAPAATATTESTPDATPASVSNRDDIYAQFGWLYSNPELAAGIDMAVKDGWSAATMQGWLQKTTWWKQHGEASRAYLEKVATDPASATQLLYNYGSAQDYIAYAAKFGNKMALPDALNQIQRVVRGELTKEALNQEMKNWAKAAYPHLSQQIDQGFTLDDIFSQYKGIVSETLGINPAEMQLSDPKWSSLLQYAEPNGTMRLPTAAEIGQKIRKDPVYGFADKQTGRDVAFAGISAISKAFGFEGGQ